MCPAALPKAERTKYEELTHDYMLKGYNGTQILKMINKQRQETQKSPLHNKTIYSYMKKIRNTGSKYYLDLLKDNTAYIILHRQKLLALELYRRMIHDNIAAQGGVNVIRPDTLNRMITTLVNITVTESRLEKEIPSLFNMQQHSQQTPEQIRQLEDEIVAGLPKELREQFNKEELRKKEEREKRLEENPSEENIDLDQYPKDSFVV
jgi:hypothetical protein